MNFISQLSEIVHKIRKTKTSRLVIGLDHNLDLLKVSTHGPMHRFLDEIMEIGLLPSVTRPTRITHSTATLIDNILIDQKYSERYKSCVLIENISDHLPCLTTLCGVTTPLNRAKKITSRDTRPKKLNALNQVLKQTDWNFLEETDDVDIKFKGFHELVTSAVDSCCPMRDRLITYKNVR